MSEPALPPLTSSPILKAIAGRCPRCGLGKLFGGRLFYGFLKVCDRCPACGLSFTSHDAADGPAVFITFITGTVAAGGALWLELANPQPFWVHAVIWPPVIVGLSLLLLRPFKGAFIGAQWKYRVGDWELGR